MYLLQVENSILENAAIKKKSEKPNVFVSSQDWFFFVEEAFLGENFIHSIPGILTIK